MADNFELRDITFSNHELAYMYKMLECDLVDIDEILDDDSYAPIEHNAAVNNRKIVISAMKKIKEALRRIGDDPKNY